MSVRKGVAAVLTVLIMMVLAVGAFGLAGCGKQPAGDEGSAAADKAGGSSDVNAIAPGTASSAAAEGEDEDVDTSPIKTIVDRERGWSRDVTWLTPRKFAIDVLENEALLHGVPASSMDYLIPGDSLVVLSGGVAEGTAEAIDMSAAAAPYARLWHASPVLGSGWNERFALYNDGTFIWAVNQMDGASRLRYILGFWDVQDNMLVLSAQVFIVWEGGEVVSNSDGHLGSYSSAEVIENPYIFAFTVNQLFALPLGAPKADGQRGLDTVTIGQQQYWDYTGQAVGAMDDFWLVLENALR